MRHRIVDRGISITTIVVVIIIIIIMKISVYKTDSERGSTYTTSPIARIAASKEFSDKQ